MARAINKLTEAKARSSRLKSGRHSDGGGLYLNVSPSGSKSWVFMWTRDGRRREMGLGSYPAVSISAARRKAGDNRSLLEDGRDPLAARATIAEPNFGECADRFVDAMETSWRNPKHRAQWRMTLTEYCQPMRRKRVSEIDTRDVLAVLSPIWKEKPETASRLRGRIERVLDYAKAKGWRNGENPALWRGHLKNVLPPRQRLSRGHHAAMAYQDVPAFVQRLPQQSAMSARALEFLILTAARSGEVLGAQWQEIDFDESIWTVPPSRMKAGRPHRVPLSDRAHSILQELHEHRVAGLLFPGERRGKPLSVTAIPNLLKRMNVEGVTVHGFRSSFRDWVGDHTAFQREVAEAALAHTVGDATERAYRRRDALEKRRELMQEWATFCRT